MKSLSTEKCRYLVVRAAEGERLPGALASELRDQAVTCGWFRGGGVLDGVELRAYEPGTRTLGPPRRIAGAVHVVSIEGSVGLAAGDVSFGMRVVLAREGDRGLETLAGELVGARVVGLELLVAAFDEHAVARGLDPSAQVWLQGEPPKPAAGATRPRAETTSPSEAPAEWSEAIAASPAPAKAAQPASPVGAPMPARLARPHVDEPEQEQVPDAGDVVEHFAFGLCDVLKSENDRLYLRMHRDGRIKEIALEMLKVTPTGEDGGHKTYKLARRL